MKKVQDLLAALDTLGIPYTQITWAAKQAPNLPYAVLVPSTTSNVFADGTVKAVPVRYALELYTRERDVPLEMRIQEALNEVGIGWQREHTVDRNGYTVITLYYMTLSE